MPTPEQLDRLHQELAKGGDEYPPKGTYSREEMERLRQEREGLGLDRLRSLEREFATQPPVSYEDRLALKLEEFRKATEETHHG